MPAVRPRALLSQAGEPSAHARVPDRRDGLLHPGQPAPGADDDHPVGQRFRHHSPGRRPALVPDPFAAGLVIPGAMIVALPHLLFTVRRGSIQNNTRRIGLYRMVELIGRWSMVDVFVDTFTAALVQLQPLMSVEPALGLFFFAAVVVLT